MSALDLAVADLRDVLARPIDASADLGRTATRFEVFTDAGEEGSAGAVVVVTQLPQLWDLFLGHDGMVSQLHARTNNANRVDTFKQQALASTMFANIVDNFEGMTDEDPHDLHRNAPAAPA